MSNRKTAIAAALLICLCTAAAPVYADKIYAGLVTGSGVAVVDLSALEAWGEIKTGRGPAILAGAGRYVFVSEFEGNSVTVIDPVKDEVVKSLDVGEQPLHIAATPDGSLVVAQDLSGRVTVIEVSGLRELRRIDAPGEVYSLTISPDGRKAYAGGKEGKLWVIDLKKFKLTDELPIPQRVYQTALTASGDRLIVNSLEDAEVTIFSLPGMKVLKKLDAGSQGLALSPDQSELWYGGPGGKIRVYSFSDDKVVAELSRDCDADLDITFSPDGKSAYVAPAGPEMHDIYVFDAGAKKKTGAVHLKETPRGLLYIKE